MTNPSIDWSKDFPVTDGPGINGYFEPGWSGELMVQMTIIVPDDGESYSFRWWQQNGGSEYQQDLMPGQNDLSFVLGDAGDEYGFIRALVWRGATTTGVNVTIPEAPVLSVPSGLVAEDDEATTSAETPVTVDVLANDTFNDEPVTLDQLEGPPTIDQQPANGTVSVAPDGKITYTPNPGFAGTDEFVYRIATPEPPEPSVICGFFGEGFAVISVPEGFSLDEPITFSVGDQSMEMHWAPWGGRWEPNFDDDYFYPQEGELAVMSQGGNSVEGNLVRGFVLTYAYGQVWTVGPEAPWFEFFVETEDGNTYYAMDNGGNYFAFTDEQPPIPPPGSPYPVKISYQDEVGVNESCGLMVTPTD